MTELPILDALAAAAKGGFYFNHGIVVITAIGCAESRVDSCGMVMDATARHTNTDGSIDRGWLQINSIHKSISDADCDDPVKAAAYAFNNLSKQGTVFSPWSTYQSGAYRNFLKQAYLAYAAWSAQNDLATANLALQQLHAALDQAISDRDLAQGRVVDYERKLTSARLGLGSIRDQATTTLGTL